MFKVKNQDTRTTSLTLSLILLYVSGFIVNFEHFSTPYSSVSIVNFEQVNAGREANFFLQSQWYLNPKEMYLCKRT